MNTRTLRIDAHQHFWRYHPDPYSWITSDMQVLQKDFLPPELAAILAEAELHGTIAVQARQDIEETRWLLELASANRFIRGVVGWVPLASPNCIRHLEEFLASGRLKGIRHFIQSEPDENFLEHEDFNCGLGELRKHGLVYEILIVERQMRAARRLVDRHPHQKFVLDHLGKPKIREGLLDPWRRQIHELAQRPNVFCKLSGLVTEADLARWHSDDLQPYVETALEAFGPKRLMFGSDWPVCLLACSYRVWQETLARLLRQLSADEQAWIWGRTAEAVYALNGPDAE
jgi:L-fuconolactonase